MMIPSMMLLNRIRDELVRHRSVRCGLFFPLFQDLAATFENEVLRMEKLSLSTDFLGPLATTYLIAECLKCETREHGQFRRHCQLESRPEMTMKTANIPKIIRSRHEIERGVSSAACWDTFVMQACMHASVLTRCMRVIALAELLEYPRVPASGTDC
uniref:Uncharacterized protein n=1 Tax=Coccidioides posadasii RMSCC 3488 TaxID=454284 RepID=A0A0J6FEW8_COCPO|nr:hypothetical protein CPAG_07994 [Coccidioides posadasii RMSCC 3488]